jgi:GDP-D-mannose dehydratase
MASRLSGHNMEVRVNPAFVRANEVRLLIGSRARLEQLVGSLPDIAFEETLRWMLEAPL